MFSVGGNKLVKLVFVVSGKQVVDIFLNAKGSHRLQSKPLLSLSAVQSGNGRNMGLHDED